MRFPTKKRCEKLSTLPWRIAGSSRWLKACDIIHVGMVNKLPGLVPGLVNVLTVGELENHHFLNG